MIILVTILICLLIGTHLQYHLRASCASVRGCCKGMNVLKPEDARKDTKAIACSNAQQTAAWFRC